MSAVWKTLEGRVINGTLPLLRCIASSDRSGVFLTESAKHAPGALALKLVRIDPALATAQLSRWHVAADLFHPHLMRTFESGRCQVGELSCLYVLTECADQSLAQLLEQRALAEQEVRDMLEPTLSALAYLHGNDLALGELKPPNILAVGDQLKLASDAVCVIGKSARSWNGVSIYDAPETRDGNCSAAADIWALGVTLCEALTRSHPSVPDEGAGRIELPSDLHPSFREIVARCLSRNPSDRPRVADLQAWMRGEAATAESTAGGNASEVATPPQPAATTTQRSMTSEPTASERAADQPASTELSAKQETPVAAIEPQATPAAASESPSGTSTLRLVIRAEILPEGHSRTAVSQHSNRRVLGLVLGAVAVLALGWIGISRFTTDRVSAPAVDVSAPAVNEGTANAPPASAPAPASALRETAPPVGKQPLPKPAPTAETKSTVMPVDSRAAEAKSAAPEVRQADTPSPSPVNEVIPRAAPSALETVRGTIRVSVRVFIDKSGAVIETATENPGPSRYFERLSREAAKKWTFTPADTEDRRTALLRFSFTRAGATARADSLR